MNEDRIMNVARCKCDRGGSANAKSALLRRLQAEDFALYEVALYLDSHPQNRRALCYFEEHKKLAAALRAEYEEKYGPLTLEANKNPTEWEWVKTPWPWEKEAN